MIEILDSRSGMVDEYKVLLVWDPEERYVVLGRGVVYAGIVPESWGDRTAQQLLGMWVNINGQVFTIRGVESFGGRTTTDCKVGLLVGPTVR